MKINRSWLLVALLLGLAVSGCGGGDTPAKPTAAATPHHEHIPPHGGTAVELGREEFHVEFVGDLPEARMTAYILDGELEQFVRVPAASFDVLAKVNGTEQRLTFKAIANAATGEKAGDTAQFEAAADWLKTASSFDGTIAELTVRAKTFREVHFNFPKGNE